MQDITIHSSKAAAQQKSSGCACGGHDEETPEMDVQTIPHAVRHASIFGALNSLRTGFSLIISATHDPVPLLKQLSERQPDDFASEYLTEGPERWRIKFTRN